VICSRRGLADALGVVREQLELEKPYVWSSDSWLGETFRGATRFNVRLSFSFGDGVELTVLRFVHAKGRYRGRSEE
jgi:hypothetical protein